MGSDSLFVECQSCGKKISSKAKVCPSCGVKFKKKLKPLHWVGIAIGVLMLIGIINSPENSTDTSSASSSSASVVKPKATISINKPADQRQFEEVIRKYIGNYKQAKNELQKSSLRTQRKSELNNVISGFAIQNWSGKINAMSTNSEGKAILSIRITPSIEIKTWNNALSDIVANTLIESNSELYNQLMNFSVGDTVFFSGYFFNSNEDSIEETSMTENGAMVNPEFLMKFINVTTTK